MDRKFSVFVNSTDSFEDCWFPFFSLFKTFWPEFGGKIYLNTEAKQFCYPGLRKVIKRGLIAIDIAKAICMGKCNDGNDVARVTFNIGVSCKVRDRASDKFGRIRGRKILF